MKKISEDNQQKVSANVTKAIKAARILKGISRKEAGRLCGWTFKVFEQIENGRCYVSEDRIRRIYSAYGYSDLEFKRLTTNADQALAEAKKFQENAPELPRRPRRNVYKKITKETRIIRILRKASGLTQYQAAEKCGYANSIFGQIEHGRIELPPDRIQHIVKRLGFSEKDFQKLFESEVLRDEMIDQCTKYLEQLEDHKLESAQMVIKALLK